MSVDDLFLEGTISHKILLLQSSFELSARPAQPSNTTESTKRNTSEPTDPLYPDRILYLHYIMLQPLQLMYSTS